MAENKTAGFSISCVRTVRVQASALDGHYLGWFWGLSWFCLVMSAHIRRLYANSRTLDIGKSCRLIFRSCMFWRRQVCVLKLVVLARGDAGGWVVCLVWVEWVRLGIFCEGLVEFLGGFVLGEAAVGFVFG